MYDPRPCREPPDLFRGGGNIHNPGLQTDGLFLFALRRAMAILEDVVDHTHKHLRSMTPEYLIVKSIEIAAPTREVWRVLTAPEMIARWMLGTRVETTWEPGAGITFDATLHGLTYQDRGTVLAIEPERSVTYSHWSDLSRLPDVPENRTLVSLVLEWTGEKTRLTVRHEQFYSYEAYGHSNFFWGYALGDIRCLAEGTPLVMTGGELDITR